MPALRTEGEDGVSEGLVGRCGSESPGMGPLRTSICALPAGHPGWHREGGVEWGSRVPTATDGVWVAFNYDGSAFVPFASELEAYRYAAGLHMNVTFAKFGDEKWMTA